MAIVEGGDVRAQLQGRDVRVDRYLPLPSRHKPELLIPLERTAARYALERYAVPPAAWKRLRNRLVAAGLARGIVPPGSALVSVAAKLPGAPFVVAGARALGVPADARWFLAPGQGDVFSRGVFTLFVGGSPTPEFALKFSRVPGYDAPFKRDERGLELARRAGPIAAEHAPQLVGRFQVADLHCSLETAAVGQRLFAVLRSRRLPARTRTIELIAGWLVDLQCATAGAPSQLEAERARLLETVLPRWNLTPDALTDNVTGIRPVLQHNDLGSWNVIVGDERFTVLDWEEARAHGFPIWDLWYLLADALAHSDRIEARDRGRHFVRLFRGELPSSALLFRWTRRAVAKLHIPPSTVGSLATLCWLHHGLSDRDRRRESAAHIPGSAQPDLSFDELGRLWLSEPGLGPGWSLWKDD